MDHDSSASEPLRLAVFASGRGTNFQAILDAIDRQALPARVVVLVTSNAEAGAAERARSRDIPVVVHAKTPDAREETRRLLEHLSAHSANFVALAGYLRLIPAAVVREYRGRMLNVHPAMLPAFGGKGMYGMNVHRAVIEYGARWSGVTIHLVDETYDTGPIVLQKPVPVHEDDTPESLAERIHSVEHRLYPLALRLFAENRVIIRGRRVFFRKQSEKPHT